MTDMSFSVQLQLVEHLLLTVCTSFPATLTEIGKPNSGSLARMENYGCLDCRGINPDFQ